MLSIKELNPTGSTAPFALWQLPDAIAAYSPPPITPGLLGMAIGNSIRASRAEDKRQITLALSNLDFSARESLVELTARLIEQRSLPITMIKDAMLAAAVRKDDFKNLPQQHDAILDIRIDGAGYYSDRKLGLVPYLSVSTRLLNTKNGGDVIEEFGYEVASGTADGDPRFFPSPPGLIVTDVQRFKQDATSIKRQLLDLYELVAVQMVSDIEGILKRQPQ